MPFKALIIDDDLSFRKLLELRLKSFIPELECAVFSSLGTAREHIAEFGIEHYQLVVLDQHLPDGNGVDLLKEGLLKDVSVLSVSSDDSPDLPGENVQAGAAYFLNKVHISQPLFKPLIQGILERARLVEQLQEARTNQAVMESIKTLVSTLRHEINNPLGAVLGAAYLINTDANSSADLKEAAHLVEQSGRRIKHVLDELCEAMSLEPVTKAHHKVFHIPGDKPWES